jgi:hypothetical protein
MLTPGTWEARAGMACPRNQTGLDGVRGVPANRRTRRAGPRPPLLANQRIGDSASRRVGELAGWRSVRSGRRTDQRTGGGRTGEDRRAGGPGEDRLPGEPALGSPASRRLGGLARTWAAPLKSVLGRRSGASRRTGVRANRRWGVPGGGANWRWAGRRGPGGDPGGGLGWRMSAACEWDARPSYGKCYRMATSPPRPCSTW